MKSDTSVRLLCGATITHNGEPSEADATIIVKNLHGIHHQNLASLYAAAPDLLKALRDLVTGENQTLTSRLVDQAFKAIAKAEGKL